MFADPNADAADRSCTCVLHHVDCRAVTTQLLGSGAALLLSYGDKRSFHVPTVTAASIGNKGEQTAFTDCVKDAINQTVPIKREQWVTNFPQAAADPCLQIADYCAWALQRKWESGRKDLRSYDLIKHKIAYEYDFWQRGTKHHY